MTLRGTLEAGCIVVALMAMVGGHFLPAVAFVLFAVYLRIQK